MESLKKHIELYKINRQIRHLSREAAVDTIAPFHYIGNMPYKADNSFSRPSEKNEIIRLSINNLIDQRDAIRKS